uniref:Uncharacterized protein n=1 Tax=Rhizophora mucronata TaxID=61149 RepID=A0A2P2R435_RHIMU
MDWNNHTISTTLGNLFKIGRYEELNSMKVLSFVLSSIV